MKTFLVIVLMIFLQSAYCQNCKPYVSVSAFSNSVIQLKANKSDTIRVSVNCFEACDLILESSDFEIKSIGNKAFVIKPTIKGQAKIQVFSLCPKGMTISFSDSTKHDVSGKGWINELSYSINE